MAQFDKAQATHHAKIRAVGAGFAVAIPVAIFVVCLWFLRDRPEYGQSRWFGPIAAALVLPTPFSGFAVPRIGGILALVVGIKLLMPRHVT